MHAMYPQILSTYSMCVACVYLDLCALKTMAQALQSVVLSILKGGGGQNLKDIVLATTLHVMTKYCS